MTKRPVGMGCMRLSTGDKVDDNHAQAVFEAALEAGVTLFDTAASYGKNDKDLHQNERILAKALGDADVEIVTKCGMRRPAGKWRPDGRRKAILEDAELSRRALGVESLDLLLLHAPDPKTKWETSIRALAAAKDSGITKGVGLSNVKLRHLEQAWDLVPIDAVQLAISPFDEDAVRSGVVERCFELGIRVIAHSPLGGPKKFHKLAEHEDLDWIATQHSVTPQTIALAWLYSLHPLLTPIPGATRIETARLAAEAATIELRDDERALLDDSFAIGRLLRTSRDQRAPRSPKRTVTLFVGVPAAGKTGYAGKLDVLRLSRDERGGSLKQLAAALGDALEEGAPHVLMDATYPTRTQRSYVLETAWEHGAGVGVVWFETPLAEAQINAVDRILERHDRLLMPETLAVEAKKDPNMFPPMAQYRFRDTFEEPSAAEGFASIQRVPFERRAKPDHTRVGLVIDLEALVDVARFPRVGPFAKRIEAFGKREADDVLVLGWLPKVGAGRLLEDDVHEAFAAWKKEHPGLATWTLKFCPHEAGPPRCWCRRPLPGLVVEWMRNAKIDPKRSTYVGTSTASRQLAEALRMTWEDA